ncbi:NAD-dependent epimerase/dehydratase family protein [Roseomonas sp. JC162]|uniref:NAD-dependent epimerase/dehydratase family protein n=1 Tax=Neoroseomonas marina TaxID=1232220 RepID=A0A848EDT4_9PROT|nr:GDP-mannose 4,6-dehydratase [Neoroseomonas marina]MBL0965368.1 GDP-mannose 4,6-dehydratase [Blastomonas sp.]NMJ41495.1 NAD-dependent epimerase/dehydratase family protein [Neoroseomonas marina]
MKGRRALVTGAGGFIGSHLVEALVEAGADVTALLHYNADAAIGNLRLLPPDVLARVQLVHGDINDADFVRRLVAKSEVIFHLGALIAIPHSYSAPRSYVQTNVGGTLNVLEAVRAGDGQRLVHTSTSEVYGSARYVPIDEAHPLQAQSPYAATKIAADKLVESYVRSFGLAAVTVRPFNTFGPRQSARAFIPTVIGQVLGGAAAVKLGATTPVRDLTYVGDTVAGFIAAATTPGIEGGCFNLGTGTGVAVGDVATRIMALMGSQARIELDAQRLRPAASEVDRLISANGAFTAASGWRPMVSLDEGLRRTIAFFERHRDLLPSSGYVT